MILNNFISNLIDYVPFLGYRDHYNFSFNVNQPLPQNSDEIMERCCNVLDSIGIKYSLASGTALGIYRNGQFIPHDNDIDINVLGQIDFVKINQEFQKIGMSLGRKLTYRGKVQQLIYYSKEKVLFDICFWEKKGEYIYNYCEKGFVRKHPFDYYSKFERVKFKGKEYFIPSPIEKWLEMQYGSDWCVPKKSKGDWTKECHDIYPV